jgi:hypothetical protein
MNFVAPSANVSGVPITLSSKLLCSPWDPTTSSVALLFSLTSFLKPLIMATERPNIVLSTPGVSQQTPCDTLPVPQNLVVNRIVSTADSPVISSSMSVTESVTPQSASTLAGLAGQPTPPGGYIHLLTYKYRSGNEGFTPCNPSRPLFRSRCFEQPQALRSP